MGIEGLLKGHDLFRALNVEEAHALEIFNRNAREFFHLDYKNINVDN